MTPELFIFFMPLLPLITSQNSMACRKHFFEKLPGNGGTTTTAALHLNVGQLLFGLDMTEYDTDYQGKRGGGGCIPSLLPAREVQTSPLFQFTCSGD